MASVLERATATETFERLQIFLRSWQPAEAPTAVAVICHGFNAHSGQYAWAAEQFAAQGYAVYAPDLRGRGESRVSVSMSRTSPNM